MYRPTVRYSKVYRDYVEGVFKATSLDRNQIMRLALFSAAHSPQFNSILEKYRLADVPLPHPEWGIDEENCWKEQSYIKKEQTKQPSVSPKGCTVKIINNGGIKFTL